MVNLLKIFKGNSRTSNSPAIYNTHDVQLIDEIKGVCSELANTESWFQTECNNDLIEACIYKREFLTAKYNYLIKKFKSTLHQQNKDYK